MRIFVILLLLVTFTLTASAQKSERSESDFTTTPFQDASAAKGLSTITEGYYEVEDGEYTEGDITIKLPLTLNTATEKFTVDSKAMVLKLAIYSLDGTKVYEGKMTNEWNGKNTAGEVVSAGLYVYTIDARITPNATSKLAGFIKVK